MHGSDKIPPIVQPISSISYYFLIVALEILDEENGIYEGYTEYHQKSGLGSFLYHNGNFYNGSWQDNEINGYGTLYFSNGQRFKGNFLNSKLDGFGRAEYQNGDIYIGLWKNGEYNGKGLFYSKSMDRWMLGEFERMECKTLIQNGKGKPSSISIFHFVSS